MRGTKAVQTEPATVDGGLPRLPHEGQKDEVLVKPAIDYLRQNMAEPPLTEELVKTLGTHGRGLSKAFQAHFGTSVVGWLREERLQQAMHLLVNTQVPIASLGDVLGYSSLAKLPRPFATASGARRVKSGRARP
jgi:transcriptional regulator GlxA family with amidase domain